MCPCHWYINDVGFYDIVVVIHKTLVNYIMYISRIAAKRCLQACEWTLGWCTICRSTGTALTLAILNNHCLHALIKLCIIVKQELLQTRLEHPEWQTL